MNIYICIHITYIDKFEYIYIHMYIYYIYRQVCAIVTYIYICLYITSAEIIKQFQLRKGHYMIYIVNLNVMEILVI